MSQATYPELLTPVSSDSPTGANLEYDPRFVEMIRLAEGTREQQYGNTIVAAQPPDWRAISPLASQLACETRDLRLAVVFVELMTCSEGLPGLAGGLELLQHWVCQFWDDVHPQLEEEDGNDSFVRINALGRLCESDRLPVLIARMPLVEAPPHVTVRLEDVQWAQGSAHPSPKTERPTPMEIEAAFLSLSLAELRQRYETAQRAELALAETVRFLEQTAGQGVWDAGALVEQLSGCSGVLKEHLRARLSASDSVVSSVAAAESADDPAVTQWEHQTVDQSITSLSKIRVESRDEAAQVISAATRYFERHEPSSPVPLLLRRAKRLINQDFVDILRDLAPDALVQAKNLSGETDE